jgi:hypothetical protein
VPDPSWPQGWEGGGWTATSQRALYGLLRAWQGGPIGALLFGHLHTASVRLLSPTATAGADTMPVMYLSPSFTPRNPTPHAGAVRLVTLTAPLARPPAAKVPAAKVPAEKVAGAKVVSVVDHSLLLEASNGAKAAVWEATALHAAHNLSSYDYASWARWAGSLHADTAFARHMPPQRCADEIEPDYAKCKAAVVCALVHLEPRPYAECLQRVRSHAVQPAGWVAAQKRMPP